MKSNSFPKFAWFVLGYNMLVILWGAFVRATGSGAGCGAHWPLCNGQVVPQSPAVQTSVEFIHRISSGLALLLAVGLLVWAWRSYAKGSPVRLGAGLVMFFMITESLVGAMLVLFRWVAMDQSVQRVYSISLHLVNTFLLLGSLTLTAWWASGGGSVRLRGQKATHLGLFAVAFAGTLLIGVSGAITALGDTLFPAGTLGEGVAQDFLPTAHFLVRLRVIHPLVAVVVGVFVLALAYFLPNPPADRKQNLLSTVLVWLTLAQLAAGALNVIILAPVWMQILHLLLADLVWVILVLFSAQVLRRSQHADEQAADVRPVFSSS